MKARDIMQKRVTAATPRAIGRDVAQQLLSGMYSGLPVVSTDGNILGVITEFDLLHAIREGRDLETIRAEEVMSRPAICVEEEDSVDTIITTMTAHHIIRVPVTRRGKLVGIISRSDILSHMLEPEFVTYFGGDLRTE